MAPPAPSRPIRTPPTFQDSSEPSRLAGRARLTAFAERSVEPHCEAPFAGRRGVERREPGQSREWEP
jgi:hypothetical protein